MMTTIQEKKDAIDKLQKAINSPATPENYKDKMREKITALESEIAEEEKSILPKPKKPKSRDLASKYVPHRKIKSITVLHNDKEITIPGAAVLNGAHKMEDGGVLADRADYFPIRKIVYVETTDGEKFKPDNGYWIEKSVFAEGGILPDGSIRHYSNPYLCLEDGGPVNKEKPKRTANGASGTKGKHIFAYAKETYDKTKETWPEALRRSAKVINAQN